jgi:hypothetical protein
VRGAVPRECLKAESMKVCHQRRMKASNPLVHILLNDKNQIDAATRLYVNDLTAGIRTAGVQ